MWCQPKSVPWHSKILVFGDAKKWLGLGIAGDRQEDAAGMGQPKNTEGLGNEALCAKTGGKLDRDTFASIRLPSSLLCEPGDNSGWFWDTGLGLSRTNTSAGETRAGFLVKELKCHQSSDVISRARAVLPASGELYLLRIFCPS